MCSHCGAAPTKVKQEPPAVHLASCKVCLMQAGTVSCVFIARSEYVVGAEWTVLDIWVSE